jgi:hypothetical protein
MPPFDPAVEQFKQLLRRTQRMMASQLKIQVTLENFKSLEVLL